MPVNYEVMTLKHYDQVTALWSASEGVGLSTTDNEDSLSRYLERNPDLSYVAFDKDQLVGAILCGHDGRRGYIHHLAVTPTHRHQGIGRILVAKCMTALKIIGIDKCHLFVFKHNHDAQAFWQSTGWMDRSDLLVMSKFT